MELKEVVKEIGTVVRDCGQVLLQAGADRKEFAEKEGQANFVTKYDKAVQEKLKERLLLLLPSAAFIGEEEEEHSAAGDGYAFIVDPIDGTTNFIKDYHMSCISVGLVSGGQPVAGVIYNPYLDELYTAVHGEGAFCNNLPIHVSDRPLNKGIVLFGTSPYYADLRKKSFEMAYDYCCRALDIRRSGSAALDLCAIAAGRAELFFELKLSPWDYAAGLVLVQEAGGRVTNIDGNPVTLDAPSSVLATNGNCEI